MAGIRGTLLFAALLLCAAPAEAEWAGGAGDVAFSPDTPEAEACRLAEQKAKQDALTKVLGERVAFDDIEVCRERADDAGCALARLSWASSDGEVRALRTLRRRVEAAPMAGFRICKVTLEADVARWRGESDPAFDVGVRLNQSVFRPGEDMRIALEPSQPMHVTVFQWLPGEAPERQVQRLFPNAMDRDGRISGPAAIPSADGARRYAIRMAFPAGQGHAQLATEALLVVATRQPTEFRDSYGLEEFKARLLEIPRADHRLVRKPYAVVRAP
ncbi:MAG: DUF4384 domain-containing protein [Bacteroidales bacterium]